MKGDLLIWATGVVILAGYLKTLSPSIAGGDSGEIVAEGCELGVAHPPGYPLLTMIIHAISEYAPIDFTVAQCVNAMSAMFTALAAIFLGYSVRSLSPKSIGVFGAVLAMGLFAFSPLIWQYAVTAEVFPLNTLFASFIVYLVVDFSQRRKLATAYLGAFVCGIAGCNQHTIVLYEIPLILWMLTLLYEDILQQPLILIKLGVLFVLGLVPYVYMPISDMLNPRPGAWGHVTTFQGFLHHFLRRDYGTFQLFSGATSRKNEGLWERHAAYLKDVTKVQAPAFAQYLALVGVVASILYVTGVFDDLLGLPSAKTSKSEGGKAESWLGMGKKGKKGAVRHKPKLSTAATTTTAPVAALEPTTGPASSDVPIVYPWTRWTPLALVVTQVFYFTFFHSLANLPLSDRLLYGVHQRFWMQPNILYFLWVGLGFNLIVGIGYHLNQHLAGVSIFVKQVSSFALQLLTLALVVWGIYGQWTSWLPVSDQSDQRYFQQYAQAVLSPMPADSIFMINYDQQWTSVRYMQVCEGFQSHIVSMHLSLMTYPWFYHKRALYTERNNMTFPGTYLTTTTNTVHAQRRIEEDGAFTMFQFLHANVPDHRVYIGGKFTHGDAEVMKHYELLPVGLISQILPIPRLPNAFLYSHMCFGSWERVLSFLPMLPDLQKFPEETWEWTIARDVKDRLGDTAAYLLERTIREIEKAKETMGKQATTKKQRREDVTEEEEELLVQPLVNAAYWLETAYAYEVHLHNHHRHPLFTQQQPPEPSPMTAPASLLKNLGLVHVHMLQDPRLHVYPTLPKMTKDIFNSSDRIQWPTTK